MAFLSFDLVLELSDVKGFLPARSRKSIELKIRPFSRCKYVCKIFCQLISTQKKGNSFNYSLRTLIFSIIFCETSILLSIYRHFSSIFCCQRKTNALEVTVLLIDKFCSNKKIYSCHVYTDVPLCF